MASAKNIHWNRVLAGLYILVGLSLAGCCYLDSTESAALVFEEGHGSIEKKPPIQAPFAQGLLSQDSGVCVCVWSEGHFFSERGSSFLSEWEGEAVSGSAL